MRLWQVFVGLLYPRSRIGARWNCSMTPGRSNTSRLATLIARRSRLSTIIAACIRLGTMINPGR